MTKEERKEYDRKWRAEHRQACLERQWKWRDAHPNYNADASRRYRKARPGEHYQEVKRYIEANPQKRDAYRLVRLAIKWGQLKRSPCQICGQANVHAHHSDYTSPLSVTWLCSKHHGKAHRHQKAEAVS